MKNNFITRMIRSLVLLLALGLSSQAMADAMFKVSIDTQKFGQGSPGYLDFIFTGQGTGPAVTATMTQLTGFDPAASIQLGNDASAVPGGFQLLNSANFNDVYYQATFGGVFSFLLTLSGDPSLTYFSTFSVLALDGDENELGSLLELTYMALPDGTADVFKVIDESAVTVTAAAVPEPGALALAALGLLMLALARRRA